MNTSQVFAVPKVKLTGKPLSFRVVTNRHSTVPKPLKGTSQDCFIALLSDFSGPDRYTPGIEDILHENLPYAEVVLHNSQVNGLYF